MISGTELVLFVGGIIHDTADHFSEIQLGDQGRAAAGRAIAPDGLALPLQIDDEIGDLTSEFLESVGERPQCLGLVETSLLLKGEQLADGRGDSVGPPRSWAVPTTDPPWISLRWAAIISRPWRLRKAVIGLTE